jgi:hypothetical protein
LVEKMTNPWFGDDESGNLSPSIYHQLPTAERIVARADTLVQLYRNRNAKMAAKREQEDREYREQDAARAKLREEKDRLELEKAKKEAGGQ